MTPDRRLDQLEPLLADALQKIDRLIAGQGKLVEFAANTKAELSDTKEIIGHVQSTVADLQSTVAHVKSMGEITANGLAKLTVTVNQIANEQTDFRYEVNQNIAGLKSEVNQNIAGLKSEVSQDIAGLKAEVSQDIATLKSEVSQDIATLKAGQDLILQILREKFL